MQTGIKAMDSNLASYAGKKDAGTLGQVITKWVGSPENAPAYIKDVTSRLGISANTPVDLTNPAQRLAISSAIMLHENGAAAVFRGSQGNAAAPQQQSASAAGSAIYAAPPMGAKPAADASQTAAPESMQKDYDAMLSKGPQAQQSLESLDQMIAIAKRKPAYASGILGATPGLNRVSTDAAEYDKARANLIALRGTGGGGGKDGGSTDAARANIGESVPDYGKPQDAMVSGLTKLRNQVAQDQLRRQVLTGAYNSGDSKTYTTLANGFDQNFKPSMMPTISPILQMSGAQQQAAVQAAVKANPSLRSNFEVLFNAGLLK
jgi:hypothetical protein